MVSKWRPICLLSLCAVLAAALASCSGAAGEKREVEQALSINLPEHMEVTTSIDTHGGFLGDGDTYYIMRIPEDSQEAFAAQLTEKGWSSLPSDLVSQLIDRNSNASENVFPASLDQGYYTFQDRSPQVSDAPSEVSRFPLNFTLGVYDADHGNLYYWKFDS